MKKIYKYSLPKHGLNVIRMPKDSAILHVGAQGQMLCMWAPVNEDCELSFRSFYVVATGESVDDDLQYIGTIQEGSFVWHVFELVKVEI